MFVCFQMKKKMNKKKLQLEGWFCFLLDEKKIAEFLKEKELLKN
jgi:hypothetical protein